MITSGTIKVGKTINEGDYNSRRADVEFSFIVNEGEDADQISSMVVMIAQHKLAEILGLKAPSRPQAMPPIAKVEAEGTITRHEPVTPPAPPPGVKAKKVDKPVPTGDTVIGAEDLPADAASQPEITDVDMTSEIEKVNGHLAPLQQTQKIRDLVAQYVTHPKRSRDIPQSQRADFVAKLKALVPAKAAKNEAEEI